MYLDRTKFAYEETVAHLSAAGRNPLIEAYLVQYLIVTFYSEVEERIKEIVAARLAEVTDRKVAAFIFKSSEGMIRRVKKAEINELLCKFDCGEGDIISRVLEGSNLQPYFDAITNRHKVSHEHGSSMTLDYFGKAIDCAEEILGAVKQTLAKDEGAVTSLISP